jgi:hypothetical protein
VVLNQPHQPELLEELHPRLQLLRKYGGNPEGKIQWREVKVGIFARLGKPVTRTGKVVNRLYQRRLVAMLGSIDEFAPQFELEALRQGLHSAPQVGLG